jgi:NAD(P)-dependent dehydrogenase (short-subunit alcohol dehydrogenase family)
MDSIRQLTPGAQLTLERLDLGELASVREFAQKVSREHPRIDVLVNNAGIMAIPRMTTADGFEAQIGTNHLGHFALTGLLLGTLLGHGPSRIVTVSSMVHTMGRFGALDADDLRMEHGYDKWRAYGRSKLANLLFAYELERRLEPRFPSTVSVACHPGYAATNLQSVGPQMTGSLFDKVVMTVGNSLLAQSAGSGALPTLYAATVTDVRGGDYVGPGGPFKMLGSPVKQRSNRASHDAAAARKLWETSVQLTRVDYALLRPEPARAAV